MTRLTRNGTTDALSLGGRGAQSSEDRSIMRTSRKAALTLLATSALVVVARPALATAPKTLSADQIKAIANDSSRWPALKKECDDNLNVMVEGGFANRDNSYAAAAWKDAANDYGVCYNVAA